jgi:TctA family transporter
MTFGEPELMRGFDFLVAVIGLFGVSEILSSIEDGLRFKGQKAKIDMAVVLRTWRELPRHWAISVRSSLVGCWMGITPAGATPASLHVLRIARRISKHREDFGKGRIEGVSRRDRGARRRHLRAAADAHPRRAGLPHRGGAARRADHVGAAARARCSSSSRRTSSGA